MKKIIGKPYLIWCVSILFVLMGCITNSEQKQDDVSEFDEVSNTLYSSPVRLSFTNHSNSAGGVFVGDTLGVTVSSRGDTVIIQLNYGDSSLVERDTIDPFESVEFKHVYTSADTFTLQYVATTNEGKYIDGKEVAISNHYEEPTVDFSIDDDPFITPGMDVDTITLGDTLYFQHNATNYEKLEWSFDTAYVNNTLLLSMGYSSLGPQVVLKDSLSFSWVFKEAGSQYIKLTVKNGSLVRTISKSVYIKPIESWEVINDQTFTLGSSTLTNYGTQENTISYPLVDVRYEISSVAPIDIYLLSGLEQFELAVSGEDFLFYEETKELQVLEYEFEGVVPRSATLLMINKNSISTDITIKEYAKKITSKI